ncbi:hypothetical protein ACXIZN_05415 [Amycolatopsis sp. TRM77291]
MSNKVRTNRAEIVGYFQHFLENKPVGNSSAGSRDGRYGPDHDVG